MIERLTELGIETEVRTGRAVALPASATEVAALIRLAREAGLGVCHEWIPPDRTGRESVAVSLDRLDSVEEVAAPDLTAVVGAGVSCRALDERAAGDGLYWPGTDVADGDRAIGDLTARSPGNSTRAGNALRRYTLGVTVVLPDGEILRTGSRTVKWVTGYDLRQLYIGSWGTLGIITGLILRLEALKNRESVSERYEREFEGLASVAVGEGSGHAGSELVLEKLKRELDPDGVFPPIDVIGKGACAP